MKPFPETPELLAVAERVVWFKPPSETLADPMHFLAHVMTYGTLEDLRILKSVGGIEEYREVLDHARPGVFCRRASSNPVQTQKKGGIPDTASPAPFREGSTRDDRKGCCDTPTSRLLPHTLPPASIRIPEPVRAPD